MADTEKPLYYDPMAQSYTDHPGGVFKGGGVKLSRDGSPLLIDIEAIKARAKQITDGFLMWFEEPWMHCKYGTKGWCDGYFKEAYHLLKSARTDIPDLLAAFEASEAARVKEAGEWNEIDNTLRQEIGILRREITALEHERDAMKEALKDAADALGSLIDTSERFNRPYEHPLSAYDRARRALKASK